MPDLTFAQISDSHVLPDPEGRIHGRALLPRLERVIARVTERIAERGDVDLVLFTGDQIQDDADAYPTFLRAIEELGAKVAFVPGNHDHREGFRRHLTPLQNRVPGGSLGPDSAPGSAGPEGSLYCSLRVGSARVLLLDSLWDGHVQGRLGARQLAWIDETIRQLVPGPTLVFVHHPPIPTGVDWLDPHVIEDGSELVRLLTSRGVRHLFCGHVHQPMTLCRSGLVVVTAPATSFGFGGNGDLPTLLDGPPALTWIDVEGQEVRSRVEWIGG